MGAHDFGDHTVFTKADNESTEVSLAAMTPYMGRLVKFITIDEGDTHIRVGFLSAIRRGQFILDDSEPVSQSKVIAAYNIVGKKIAGEGPEVYSRD